MWCQLLKSPDKIKPLPFSLCYRFIQRSLSVIGLFNFLSLLQVYSTFSLCYRFIQLSLSVIGLFNCLSLLQVYSKYIRVKEKFQPLNIIRKKMSVGYSTKFQESVPLVHGLFRSLSLITCHQTANIQVPTQVLTKCNTENLVKLF